MRRFGRYILNALTVLSLVLFVGTVVLRQRGRHRPQDAIRGVINRNTYTIVSVPGGISLYGPPLPAANAGQRKAAEKVVEALNNDQVHWNGILTFHRGNNAPPPYLSIENVKPLPGTAAERAEKELTLADLAPPLLTALDDTQRAAVAHLLLIRKSGLSSWKEPRSRPISGGFLSKRELNGQVESQPVPWTEVDLLGLRITLKRWKYPGPFDNTRSISEQAYMHDLVGEADFSQTKLIREMWHRRFDIQMFTVRYWKALVGTALLPLLTLCLFIHKVLLNRQRKRAGLCSICGYDLRATPGLCPECGAVPTILERKLS